MLQHTLPIKQEPSTNNVKIFIIWLKLVAHEFHGEVQATLIFSGNPMKSQWTTVQISFEQSVIYNYNEQQIALWMKKNKQKVPYTNAVKERSRS